MLGQWDAIVPTDLWWRVQDVLDRPDRKTNHTGVTVRSHLGAGLYRCPDPDCGKTVVTHGRSYRCAGHVMRTSSHVDEFVREVIAKRLERDDAADLLPGRDDPELAHISEQLDQHRGRIRRAENDYAAEIIEGTDLKRIRDAERASIAQLESQRARLTAGDRVSEVLTADDLAEVFRNADLGTQRSTIDALVTVTLLPHPRGKRGFDPDSVVMDWKSPTT